MGIGKKVLASLGALAGLSILYFLRSSGESFSDFLKTASDDDLKSEREKVRQDYCNPAFDDDYRIRCQEKLRAFDAELSKRAWGDETPHGPSYHTEHGHYLSEDDD